MKKNFLLDTNILLQNPRSIYGFEDNTVWICGTTLQELDSKKNAPGELGYNAREACRILDGLREKGDLLKGVEINNGGFLKVEPNGIFQDNLPKGYSLDKPDNRIISSCIFLTRHLYEPVILLTNDISMRVNAKICGVEVAGVKNDQVEDAEYTGHIEIETMNWEAIDKLYSDKSIPVEDVAEIGNLKYPLLENQFVTLTSGTKSALAVFQKGLLNLVVLPSLESKIKPMNRMQTYALWALLNPEIPLVILDGPAGTAKTFLSLATALEQLDMGDSKEAEVYQRLLISRPNAMTSDEDFGYLPGDLKEKMQPLLSSYYDNLEEILRDSNENLLEVRMRIDDFIDTGVIELCPLYAIRGRSIHNAFLICDEAQNASKNLIRDVVTRAGRNSKIVVAGDPRQIDNPLLDRKNNGLVYLKDAMKGSPLCAVVKFDAENCVRSALAEETIKRMR